MRPGAVGRLVTILAVLAGSLWASSASAQTAPQNSAGREVRVTLRNGARFTGRLVDLTSTEVVVRQARALSDTHQVLADVRSVETVHHNSRNFMFAGGAIGLVVALASDLCGSGRPYASSGPSGEPDCITPAPLLITAGVGVLGAIIGGAIDNERKRVLYAATDAPAFSVAPIAMRKGAGLQVRIRW